MDVITRIALVIHTGRGGDHDFTGPEIAALIVGPVLLTGLILITVFWFAMIRPIRRHRAILRAGHPSTGTIRRLHRANTRIGASRFVVRVDLDVRALDGRVLPASTRTELDILRTGPVREGMTVPVRILTENPTQVAIDWEAAAATRS